MTQKDKQIELGIVAAIIADTIMKPLYEKLEFYIPTAETISLWAIEFIKKHKKTDWEEVKLKPLSKEVTQIMCWDDAVIDFAYYKLSKVD